MLNNLKKYNSIFNMWLDNHEILKLLMLMSLAAFVNHFLIHVMIIFVLLFTSRVWWLSSEGKW